MYYRSLATEFENTAGALYNIADKKISIQFFDYDYTDRIRYYLICIYCYVFS